MLSTSRADSIFGGMETLASSWCDLILLSFNIKTFVWLDEGIFSCSFFLQLCPLTMTNARFGWTSIVDSIAARSVYRKINSVRFTSVVCQ